MSNHTTPSPRRLPLVAALLLLASGGCGPNEQKLKRAAALDARAQRKDQRKAIEAHEDKELIQQCIADAGCDEGMDLCKKPWIKDINYEQSRCYRGDSGACRRYHEMSLDYASGIYPVRCVESLLKCRAQCMGAIQDPEERARRSSENDRVKQCRKRVEDGQLSPSIPRDGGPEYDAAFERLDQVAERVQEQRVRIDETEMEFNLYIAKAEPCVLNVSEQVTLYHPNSSLCYRTRAFMVDLTDPGANEVREHELGSKPVYNWWFPKDTLVSIDESECRIPGHRRKEQLACGLTDNGFVTFVDGDHESMREPLATALDELHDYCTGETARREERSEYARCANRAGDGGCRETCAADLGAHHCAIGRQRCELAVGEEGSRCQELYQRCAETAGSSAARIDRCETKCYARHVSDSCGEAPP